MRQIARGLGDEDVDVRKLAIDQKGSPTSIELLSDSPWSTMDAQVLQARILGLSRICTKDAVKALTDLMETGGVNKLQPLHGRLRSKSVV